MIAETTAAAVLQEALKGGADFAELFLEDSDGTTVSMTGGKVETAVYRRTRGAGVRVLLGDRSAYAYTADISERALLDTARAAAAALRGGAARAVLPFSGAAFATAAVKPFSGVGNAARAALLRRMTDAARAVSPEITQTTATYLDKVRRIFLYNSEGLCCRDESPRTRACLQAVASVDGQAQTGFAGPGCRRGFEAYDGAIDVETAGREAARMAVTMLHAPECPAANAPVVIDGGFGGVIFHEACGHSLEATSVGRGNSEFCGKLGQRVAADCVSAVDDGTLENEWGSMNVDDEGNAPRRNLLIDHGVLTGYLIDRVGARRMGMAATGSARRQDYTKAPTSRMTNTFLCPGSDDDEEMIAGMEEGLYARRMGGGSVNPATGEFNFAVGEGYWVKNGAVVSPVRGATLIGKGAEILPLIDRVGKRMWMEQGLCGSLSGLVPTNVGQPRIRVQRMTIGGKGDRL